MNQKLLFLLIIAESIMSNKKYISLKVQKESGAMYYYANIKIYNYKKIRPLILDTGSDYLAVSCNKITRMENEQKDILENSFHLAFAEKSELRGSIIKEHVRFNSSKDVYDLLPKSILGCIKSRNGLFKEDFANGIIGLNHESKFLSELDGDGQSKVSLQFCLGEKEGVVHFFKKKLSENNWDFEFEYNPFFSSYSVAFTNILLGEKNFIQKNFQLNFDYGTTYLFLPTDIFNGFFETLNKFCKEDERNCATFDSIEDDDCIDFSLPDDTFTGMEDLLSTFPNLTFRIVEEIVVNNEKKKNFRDITIYPHQYFWYDDRVEEEGVTNICVGIRKHQFHFVIIGNNSLRNKKVYFDRTNMVFKLKEVNCEEEISQPLELNEKKTKNKVLI